MQSTLRSLNIASTLVLAVGLVSACDQTPPEAAAQPAPVESGDTKVANTEPVEASATTEPTSLPTVTSPDACGPIAELAAMDHRTPVPLQPMMAWHQKQNMMDHLVAIQLIVDGVAREDWQGIREASARIESSPQMQQQCQHMGAGAPGFTELALEFHERADAIGVAATAEDAQGVLAATSFTLQACTSCHSAFRQDVVGPEAWQERTGSAHNPSMMHGH